VLQQLQPAPAHLLLICGGDVCWRQWRAGRGLSLLLCAHCCAGWSVLWQVDTNTMSDADTETLVQLLPLGEEDYYSLIR